MFISTYDLLSKYIPLILPQYAYKAAQIEHKNYPVSVIVLKCLLFSQAVVSVSYTHLDVYKRQLICRS